MFIKSGSLATVLLVGSTLLFGGCGVEAPETSEEAAVIEEAVELGSTEQAVITGWTAYTSEEYPPVVCDDSSLPKSVQCTRSYCDNMRIECQPTVGVRGTSYWSAYFTDGSSNSTRYCNSGSWMTGIACKGSNCDDVSIQCTYMSNVSPKNCIWTGWMSEEGGGYMYFPMGYYPTGAACRGEYCDELRYYICQL